MKKALSEKKLEVGAFIAAMLVFLALSFNSYIVFNKHLENNIWVAHSYQIQSANNNFLSNLRDAESSELGYIITGDERYLSPFYVALDAYDSTLKSLQELTMNSSAQQKRIQKIESLAVERIELLRSGIEIRHAEGVHSALFFVNTGNGKRVMDQLTLISEQIGAEEERLLGERKVASDSGIIETMIVIIVGTVLTLILFIGNFIFLKKYIERKRASKEADASEFRRKELHWEQTLDNMLEGVQVIGHEWAYLFVNKALCTQTGRIKEELMGSSLTEIYAGAKNPTLLRVLQICMYKRVAHHFESEVTLPDQSKKYFILSVSPVEDGLFILSVDVTDAKNAEIGRNAYTTALEEMMYMTSHQVRQPICHIKGIANVLKQEVSQGELIEIIDYIEESVNKLDQYTIDLTDFINNARDADAQKSDSPETFPLS